MSEIAEALDRFERAAMAYERLGKMTRDDEKTRAMRRDGIAELASARKALVTAGRLAGLREAAEMVSRFSEAALKCERCGDIRNTYVPGGCTGEAQYRETDEFKTAVAFDGAYSAVRFFEKHLCRPREMGHDELMRELSAAILSLAEKQEQ